MNARLSAGALGFLTSRSGRHKKNPKPDTRAWGCSQFIASIVSAGKSVACFVRLLEPHLGEPRSPRELCRHTDWRLRCRGRHFCVYLADFFGVLVK
jgi:hypothetical protein